jgi:hypothetical protein
MAEHAHGDARRPDGDLVTGMKPMDRRTDPEPEEFGPKVGYGSDAVYLPPGPADTGEDGVTDEPASEG